MNTDKKLRRTHLLRTPVSWLDWKLGARLLLKYPALTIIGGLSLAGAIAVGAVGIEVADELLYKRLPFDEGGRIVRLETLDTAASRVEPRVLHDFAIWRRSLKTVAELGAARVSERNVLTGEGRVESLRVAEITASAFPLTRVSPLLGRPLRSMIEELQHATAVIVTRVDRMKGGQRDLNAIMASLPKDRADLAGVLERARTEYVSLWQKDKSVMIIDLAEYAGEHYGKLVTMYRVNGLVPPGGRPSD